MLTEKEKKELKVLQDTFIELIQKKEKTKSFHKIGEIEKRMNEILIKASLFERLCTKEIIFDSDKNDYRLLTRPIYLSYAIQDETFIKNEDFQNKFTKALELRKNGYCFLDCFRIRGYFQNNQFICTRIKFCDKFDTEGNEYLQIDFPNGILENGKIEKKKKGVILYENILTT